MEFCARFAQLLLQHGSNTQPFSCDQNLEPQSLRAFVERSIAHLHCARVPDAIAHDVYGQLRAGELLEIGSARSRYVQIGLRAPAWWRADDARVEEAPAGPLDDAGNFVGRGGR